MAGARLAELAGLRGLAALYVLGYHVVIVHAFLANGWPDDEGPAAALLAAVLDAGWLGLDFFFVLSGFLLARPYFARHPGRGGQLAPPAPGPDPFPVYLERRLLRVLPPYYAALALALLLAAVPGYAGIVQSGWDIAAHAALLHAFDGLTIISINPVFWSLAIEVQAYLVMPWVAAAMRGRRWWLPVATVCALSLAWRWGAAVWAGPDGGPVFLWSSQLPGFLVHFAFGAAAARLHRDGRSPIAPASRAATAVGGLAAVAIPVVVWMEPRLDLYPWQQSVAATVLVRPLIAVGCAALILAVLPHTGRTARSRLAHAVLGRGPLAAIGERSYSLYLTHFFLPVVLLWEVPAAWGLATLLAATLALALPLAWLFYRVAERPCLVLLQRGSGPS